MQRYITQKRIMQYAIVSLCILGSVLFLFPHTVSAITKPFGGRTTFLIDCKGGSKYVVIGPPVGGNYVWTPATRTYLYGPPSMGRWNLGTAGPAGICVISINPPIFFFGLTMIMLGTSGGI